MTDTRHTVSSALEIVRYADGLFIGLLDAREVAAFNVLVAEGLAHRSYEGAAGLLGNAKVRIHQTDEQETLGNKAWSAKYTHLEEQLRLVLADVLQKLYAVAEKHGDRSCEHDVCPEVRAAQWALSLPAVRGEWQGENLLWHINGDEISDHDLRNWCANNMPSPFGHVDVVRLHQTAAYANRQRLP